MGVITLIVASGCGAAPMPKPAAAVTIDAGSAPVATAPPAAARESIDLGEIAVTTAPVLFTVAPEPDVVATVRPLLSREAQQKWSALDAALRETNDPLRRRMNEARWAAVERSVRHPICGDDASVKIMPADPIVPPETAPLENVVTATATKSTSRANDLRTELMKALERDIALTAERGPASLVALGFLEEMGLEEMGPVAPSDDEAARREHAASLYRKVKAKVSLDTPVGFLARARLAGIASAADAASEYDALLGVDLASPALRPWVRSLAGHRLPDYVKAAGVFRAIALSADAAVDKIGARTEWMVATYDAGNWPAALDLATVMMRDAAHGVPHAAFDVAEGSIARLGGLERVSIDLPAAPFATLMHHLAAHAFRDGDWSTAERAARSLLDHAPESVEAPSAIWIVASVRALRGDAAADAERAAKVAAATFAPKSAWGERLRATRSARHGFPSDAQIALFSASIAEPLPRSPATEDARKEDLRARLDALSARCLAHPADAGDPGKDGTRVNVTVRVFPDRDPEIEAAPARSAAGFSRAVACLGANGARFFRDATSSVRVVFVASR